MTFTAQGRVAFEFVATFAGEYSVLVEYSPTGTDGTYSPLGGNWPSVGDVDAGYVRVLVRSANANASKVNVTKSIHAGFNGGFRLAAGPPPPCGWRAWMRTATA